MSYYTIDFHTLADTCYWNEPTLVANFLKGRNATLKDKIYSCLILSCLYQLMERATHLDKQFELLAPLGAMTTILLNLSLLNSSSLQNPFWDRSPCNWEASTFHLLNAKATFGIDFACTAVLLATAHISLTVSILPSLIGLGQ